ncbi:MAG: hypothetical protein EDM05_000420 (plasmid) [Leptolyngbya sp. IPPAS B-1204]
MALSSSFGFGGHNVTLVFKSTANLALLWSLFQSAVEIRAVNTPEDADRFLDLPNRVYTNDPNWVPPLRSSVAKTFAADNPFFEYGRLQRFWLGATRGSWAGGCRQRSANRAEGQRSAYSATLGALMTLAWRKLCSKPPVIGWETRARRLVRGRSTSRPTTAVCFGGWLRCAAHGADAYNPPYYPNLLSKPAGKSSGCLFLQLSARYYPQI